MKHRGGMIQTIEELEHLLSEQCYMSYHDLATAIFLAVKPEKPLFLEGEAGVGKTEVAKVLSQGLARICNNPERASLR